MGDGASSDRVRRRRSSGASDAPSDPLDEAFPGPMARVGDAGSGGGVVVFETRSEKLRSAPEIVQSARGQQRASQRARLKELARRAHLAAHRGRSTRDRRGTRSGRARRTRDVDFMAAKPYTLCARAPSPRRRRRRRLQNDRSIERAFDPPTHDAIFTLVPIRPRSRGERRSLRTYPSLPPPPSPRSTTTVPYLTAADANAVCTTLSVDDELRSDEVEKTLRVDGASLVACVRLPRFSPPRFRTR